MASAFSAKFFSKIKKIDPEQLEGFIAQVLREKAFLEVVFNAISEGIIVSDAKRKVVFINDAAGNILNLDARAVAGRELDKLPLPAPLAELLREFRSSESPIRRREVSLRTPLRRLFNISILPVADGDGPATHTILIVNDCTAMHRAAEEQQRIQSIESLAALTAGVAHEIKNPLNSLHIHTQLIHKAVDESPRGVMPDDALDRLDKSASVLIDEIQRLARIVDSFTRAVRPVKPNLRKASVNHIVESLAELMTPECEERAIALTLDLDPEIPQILLDSEQIQQALLNIVKNAVEAIEGENGAVHIHTSLKSDHVLIEVEDNGIGIPEADRLRIFEPYHSTKFHGTGLGLMMVYRIVKAHHGAIALSSEEGIGTTFSIALPLDERPVRRLPSEVVPPLAHLDEPAP
ncbi:PAS domain-containing protein [Candidatus Sumerlaeota bacterium]|nr:PAS domain-containing protein [Candidatus Sumerlaeota bacterium]